MCMRQRKTDRGADDLEGSMFRKRAAACSVGTRRQHVRGARQRPRCPWRRGFPGPQRRRRAAAAGHGRPEAASCREGFGFGKPDHDPGFQGRSPSWSFGSQKDERFELFAVYRICNWSGALGPKLTEGDRQSPEGLLFHRIASVAPDRTLAAVARYRLSQHVRQGARTYRLLHPGSRRLHVDGLLRHDQRRDGGNLRAQRGRACAGDRTASRCTCFRSA